MSTKRYYTVVFEISNEDSFKQFVAPLAAALSVDDEDGNQVADGLRIVACGDGDTMTAYDALAQQLQDDGHNVDDIVLGYCEEEGLDGPATIG